jgi:hypothetical protein
MSDECLFTSLIRERKDNIKQILGSDSDIVEKVVMLRRLAREIARKYFNIINYQSIDDFYKDYENGKSPLVELEGSGFREKDLIILNKCPSVPLFDDFKVNGEFPEYWTKLPQQYMDKFKNEAILQPLCIVHQTCRDLLASQIPKGRGVVHSIGVACRSGATGKVVYSDFGLSSSVVPKEGIAKAIDGFACAFHLM